MDKTIFRSNPGCGRVIYFLAGIILSLDAALAYFSIALLFFNQRPDGISALILVIIPVSALNILFFDILVLAARRLSKKNKFSLIIDGKGIAAEKIFLSWKDIKSISFSTGRNKGDLSAFEGIKLFSAQKIFLLDRQGNEFSAVIDYDYFWKKGRKKNNLILAREALIDAGKTNLISDWAQQ